MLTLCGGQVECLWDEVLPVRGAGAAGGSGAAGPRCCAIRRCWRPIAAAWEQSARGRGRPSISMATFVRLMVVKQRTGWGYETLVREVSDSLHLRRFCQVAIDQRVPEESTVSKLARRFGTEVVEEITQGRDREGDARDALQGTGGADRLDSDRGGHPLSLRRDARACGRAGPGPAGTEGERDDQGQDGAGQGSLALYRQDGSCYLQDARAPHGRGEDPGDEELNEHAGRLVAVQAREAQRLAAAPRVYRANHE